MDVNQESEHSGQSLEKSARLENLKLEGFRSLHRTELNQNVLICSSTYYFKALVISSIKNHYEKSIEVFK